MCSLKRDTNRLRKLTKKMKCKCQICLNSRLAEISFYCYRREKLLSPEMVEKHLNDILIRYSETVEKLAIG